MVGIIYTIAVILLAIWIVGLIAHITFAAFHLLLVLAVILVLWNLIAGRRSAV